MTYINSFIFIYIDWLNFYVCYLSIGWICFMSRGWNEVYLYKKIIFCERMVIFKIFRYCIVFKIRYE